ncbi:MAG: RHS repeat domain-containing protein [Aureispira sp.]
MKSYRNNWVNYSEIVEIPSNMAVGADSYALERAVGDRGNKVFELSNHLGNVLATVSDKKLGRVLDSTSFVAAYYEGQVQSAQDYYAFGWNIPSRKFNTGSYRHGFNGKENDSDFGEQLIQDYGFRIYNPLIAKFLSVDPLARDYPFYTPYQFAGNSPIRFIDLDGLEPNDPPVFVFEGFGESTGAMRLKVTSAFEDMRQNGPDNVRRVMNTIANATDEYGNKLEVTIKACPDVCISPKVPPVSSMNRVIVLWPNSDVLDRVAYAGKEKGTWVADDFTATLGNELKHVYDYFTKRIWTQEDAVAAIIEGREDEIPEHEYITVPGSNEVLNILELESNLFTNDIREWKGLPLENVMGHEGGQRFDSTEERDDFIEIRNRAAAKVRRMEKMREEMIKKMQSEKENDDNNGK